jgi:membrane protein YdbS with pleckstrin-like domain
MKTFSPGIMKKAERWAIFTIAIMVAVSIVATLWASGASLAENISRIPTRAVWVLMGATVVQNLLRFARYQVAAHAPHPVK